MLIDALRARGVDGLILAARSARIQRSRARSRKASVVTVNRRVDDPNVSSVTNDEASGIGLAVRHMIELGHRQIAHIAGPRSLSTGLMRHQAFLGGPAGWRHRAGLRADREQQRLQRGARANVAAARCSNSMLPAAHRFTAIVCANDRLAIGAIRTLRDDGHACPHDVSVSGYNDMAFVDRIDPPLTTVRIQKREAGARAAAILLRSAAPSRGIEPEHVVLPVELDRARSRPRRPSPARAPRAMSHRLNRSDARCRHRCPRTVNQSWRLIK